MLANPLEQFVLHPIIKLSVLGYDISITNSSFVMLISFLILVLSAIFSLRGKSGNGDGKYDSSMLVPTRGGMASEKIYEFVHNMLSNIVEGDVRKYVPFAFTLFTFIVITNLVAIIPGSFTVMSHISVTFSIAFFIFCAITIIGFAKHKLHYLSLFIPKGVPLVLLPLIFVIELFAYVIRPVSLSLRLTVNMTAGHIMLKVIASLAVASGILGVMPFALLVLLTGFEIFISVLQAYIFTMLSCIYLNDAVNLH